MYKYKHTKGDISTINLNNETCTCNEIVDKGVCIHLIRVALLEKYNLQGMITNDKFSTRLMRRKKPASEDKNSSSSFSETDDDYNSPIVHNSPIAHNSPNAHKSPIAQKSPVRNSQVVVLKKQVGRPRKVPAALVIEQIVEKKLRKSPLVAVRSSKRIEDKLKKK